MKLKLDWWRKSENVFKENRDVLWKHKFSKTFHFFSKLDCFKIFQDRWKFSTKLLPIYFCCLILQQAFRKGDISLLALLLFFFILSTLCQHKMSNITDNFNTRSKNADLNGAISKHFFYKIYHFLVTKRFNSTHSINFHFFFFQWVKQANKQKNKKIRSKTILSWKNIVFSD